MKITSVQKWFLIAAMWAVIIALIFSFYWTKVRPVKIRRICAEKACKFSKEFKSGKLSEVLELNQAVYADCLRRNGIEK